MSLADTSFFLLKDTTIILADESMREKKTKESFIFLTFHLLLNFVIYANFSAWLIEEEEDDDVKQSSTNQRHHKYQPQSIIISDFAQQTSPKETSSQ